MLLGPENKGQNRTEKISQYEQKVQKCYENHLLLKGRYQMLCDTVSIKLINPCGKESLEYDPQRSANLGAERAALGEMVELGHSVFHKVRFYFPKNVKNIEGNAKI